MSSRRWWTDQKGQEKVNKWQSSHQKVPTKCYEDFKERKLASSPKETSHGSGKELHLRQHLEGWLRACKAESEVVRVEETKPASAAASRSWAPSQSALPVTSTKHRPWLWGLLHPRHDWDFLCYDTVTLSPFQEHPMSSLHLPKRNALGSLVK